jgi:hypothetical protein
VKPMIRPKARKRLRIKFFMRFFRLPICLALFYPRIARTTHTNTTLLAHLGDENVKASRWKRRRVRKTPLTQ